MTITIPDQLIYRIRMIFIMLAIFCIALGATYFVYFLAQTANQQTTLSDQVDTQNMQLKGQQYDNKQLQTQLSICRAELKKAQQTPTPTNVYIAPIAPTDMPITPPE